MVYLGKCATLEDHANSPLPDEISFAFSVVCATLRPCGTRILERGCLLLPPPCTPPPGKNRPNYKRQASLAVLVGFLAPSFLFVKPAVPWMTVFSLPLLKKRLWASGLLSLGARSSIPPLVWQSDLQSWGALWLFVCSGKRHRPSDKRQATLSFVGGFLVPSSLFASSSCKGRGTCNRHAPPWEMVFCPPFCSCEHHPHT